MPEHKLRHMLCVAGWKGAATKADAAFDALFSDPELLLYEAGSFFLEHVDGQRYADQVAVILFIHREPGTTGGCLEAVGDQGTWFSIAHGEDANVCVIVKAGTRHRVTPVITGRRWVAKAVIWYTQPREERTSPQWWPTGTSMPFYNRAGVTHGLADTGLRHFHVLSDDESDDSFLGLADCGLLSNDADW